MKIGDSYIRSYVIGGAVTYWYSLVTKSEVKD